MIGYYYCSLDTFLNILKNKEIYLSDPLKMNDKLEIRWYLDRLNDDNKEDAFDSVFERMRIRSGLEFSFDDLLNCLNFKGQRSVYISCFSKKQDLLSQWRAYADDGRGVSIGFDLNKLVIADNFWIENIEYTNNIVENERVSIASQNGVTRDFTIKISDHVKKEHLYAPMHYIETNSLLPSIFDTYSKEPNFKYVPVKIEKVD